MSIPAHKDSKQYQSSNTNVYNKKDIAELYNSNFFLQNIDLHNHIKPKMSENPENPKSTSFQVAPVATWPPKFVILLEAVQIKLHAITKQTGNSESFDVWKADIFNYSTFVPAIPEYLQPGALPSI